MCVCVCVCVCVCTVVVVVCGGVYKSSIWVASGW